MVHTAQADTFHRRLRLADFEVDCPNTSSADVEKVKDWVFRALWSVGRSNRIVTQTILDRAHFRIADATESGTAATWIDRRGRVVIELDASFILDVDDDDDGVTLVALALTHEVEHVKDYHFSQRLELLDRLARLNDSHAPDAAERQARLRQELEVQTTAAEVIANRGAIDTVQSAMPLDPVTKYPSVRGGEFRPVDPDEVFDEAKKKASEQGITAPDVRVFQTSMRVAKDFLLQLADPPEADSPCSHGSSGSSDAGDGESSGSADGEQGDGGGEPGDGANGGGEATDRIDPDGLEKVMGEATEVLIRRHHSGDAEAEQEIHRILDADPTHPMAGRLGHLVQREANTVPRGGDDRVLANFVWETRRSVDADEANLRPNRMLSTIPPETMRALGWPAGVGVPFVPTGEVKKPHVAILCDWSGSVSRKWLWDVFMPIVRTGFKDYEVVWAVWTTKITFGAPGHQVTATGSTSLPAVMDVLGGLTKGEIPEGLVDGPVPDDLPNTFDHAVIVSDFQVLPGDEVDQPPNGYGKEDLTMLAVPSAGTWPDWPQKAGWRTFNLPVSGALA